MAAARERPIAADLPRPLPAVRATVHRRFLSAAASTKVSSALAWSTERTRCTIVPIGCVSRSDAFSSINSGLSRTRPAPWAFPVVKSPEPASEFAEPSRATGLMAWMCEEIGRTLSSSSSTRHALQLASERMKRSLKRGCTSVCDSVRNRACASMDIVYSCWRDTIDLSSITTIPPPSTVSIVRASTFGVTASKSCSTSMPNVFPRMRCVSR
mmetsp:Transcript_1571/g.2564  ORF Transcript_1571/g.2564 Transcript_1571/m.2564 type:complete len:212 (-) Transcript_1571:52-687(-)